VSSSSTACNADSSRRELVAGTAELGVAQLVEVEVDDLDVHVVLLVGRRTAAIRP
jgi:hypothetical protein